MVARSLLDTLKAVSEDERDCIAVLERVSRLAEDSGKPQFDPSTIFIVSFFGGFAFQHLIQTLIVFFKRCVPSKRSDVLIFRVSCALAAPGSVFQRNPLFLALINVWWDWCDLLKCVCVCTRLLPYKAKSKDLSIFLHLHTWLAY